MVNGEVAGNLLIPAAILFSDNTYRYQHIHDFAKCLNVQLMSSSHYYKVQEHSLFPLIHSTWIESQALNKLLETQG